MKDADWLYHLTRKEVALIIKRGGMTTALSRIGMPVPHPKGAYVQNRKKKEETEFQQQLRGYLVDLMAHGYTREQILAVRDNYLPFHVVLRGSNEHDVWRVDAKEKEYLAQFRESLPGQAKYDRAKFNQAKKDINVEMLANTMLIRNKNHFLARLAVQYVTYRNNIEEIITASHIYFLKPKDVHIPYNDYKKHLGDTTVVVLRVHKDNLPGLVQDDSEARAMMTKIPVLPNVIQVMENHEKFIDENYRSDARNWQPLANLQ
ncbi:MAG TPA: hypothetical protein VGD69_26665 [Herpetosiphonaceae bacterium]